MTAQLSLLEYREVPRASVSLRGHAHGHMLVIRVTGHADDALDHLLAILNAADPEADLLVLHRWPSQFESAWEFCRGYVAHAPAERARTAVARVIETLTPASPA